MEINKVLGQYELDWACHTASHKDYPYNKLKNKTVYVAGTQEFFSKAVVYFLFGLNDLQKLNMKITLVAESTAVLNQIFPALLKREDFTFRLTEDLETLNDDADFFIYTGCCSKAIDRSPDFFFNEINQMKKHLEFAGRVKVSRFILLSDYRVYGKVDRGVLVSEYEYGNVDFTKGSGFDAELLQTLESLLPIYGKKYDFSHLILRSGILLGAGADFDNNLFYDMFRAVSEGKEFEIIKSRKKYSFTYINDLLNALFWSMIKLQDDTIYNVVSKDCTISTGMLVAKIYDLYPDDCKINLVDIGKDPNYGVAMNCQKLPVFGFEPEVTMDEIIQLMVTNYKNKDELFLYQDTYQGKLEIIHNILLGYLLEVDRICKKHNIKYFLAGGTLLGAIRHHGFIPWDDDADVMMLREDYEKFLSVVQKELPGNITLQTTETDPKTHCIFTKLRIDNTLFSTKFTSMFMDMHNGVFFDVLSHDQTANSKLGRKIHLQLTLLTRSLVFNKWHKRKIDNGHKVQSFFADILKNIFPIKFSEWLQFKCLRFFEKKKDAKYLYDGMGRNVYKGDFPKYYLDEVIEWDFEGHKFPVPKEYDKYLRYLYGDYEQLVLPWQRQTSHAIVVMDLGEYAQYKVTADEKTDIVKSE
ncbi:MAG: LicD family protein [Acutalibacteraceae bacterium]|nr:LicD family protein [Acutalibacteraceae bacterium]